MVQRPAAIGAFEFVALSSLRAAQLQRGCVPTIDSGDHRASVTAQLEVAGGHVTHMADGPTEADVAESDDASDNNEGAQ